MLTEDGRLCLARVEGLNLHLLSLMASIDGLVIWTHERFLDLEKFLAPEVVATCIYGVQYSPLAAYGSMVCCKSFLY